MDLLFILVLAMFLGFELISKVPSTLHTPLMSGSNAISGITLVGALTSLNSEALNNSGFTNCISGCRRCLRHHQRCRWIHGYRSHVSHVQEER